LPISANTVARLLHDMNYTLRVNHKELASASSPERNQQFDYISALRTRFVRQQLPMISVDTKKRELVGNFKNPGAKWDRSPARVNDHDFRSDSLGVAIPYGIYDLLANRGSVFVGVSHDTPAFAAHCIAGWWQREGAVRYRRARRLLILADSGGSNGHRCRAWRPNSNHNCAIASNSPSPWPIIRPAPQSGILSSIACSPRYRKTGLLSP
jgi:Rhodopirellula transposase.